ncbi:DMT family transporter [Arcanobacterium haemolyticum]|nr:DMT family transporter [Arcanobacterium haemolyticum]
MAENDTAGHNSHERRHYVAAFAVAALSGLLIAIQGVFNGGLSSSGAGPVLAGWVSYVGTLLAVVVVLAIQRHLGATFHLLRTQSAWWWYAVGLGGIPIVITMSWGIPIVGVAVSSVCSVAGQTVMSLILDSFGVGLPHRIKLSARRILAALVALAGLALAVGSGIGDIRIGLLVAVGLLIFASGATIIVQSAGNGEVTARTGNPLTATLTSVLGGTTVISVILLVVWLTGHVNFAALPGINAWWAYAGGPLGAGVTFCAAWSVRRLGTFSLTLAVVAGQMVTSMLLDLLVGNGVGLQTAMSVAVMIVATMLVAQPDEDEASEESLDHAKD